MNGISGYLTSLNSSSRLRLLVGVTLLTVLTAAALWWAFAPRQQLLFGNLREADAAEIVASLQEWKVPFGITDGGAGITVASDKVYETRMKLVSSGVPKGGHVGFELFDDADFGVTEFAQRVNYQRALQGEIERTVAAIPGVDSARVHLTIQRAGLFVAEREVSKASVTLSMHPGASMTRAQVAGIQGLVASAVEGLTASSVAVLGPKGELLSGGSGAGQGGIGIEERQSEQARYEVRLRTRIDALLRQVVQAGRFVVSVDVQLNYDTVREVNERLLAQGDSGNGLLARQRTTSSDNAEKSGRSQNLQDNEYVHGTAREEISRALGRIDRISVAVILPPELDESDVERIRSLVSAAAGVDAERGDRLEVSRMRGDGRQRFEAAPRAAIAVASVGEPLSSHGPTPSGARMVGWQKAGLFCVIGLLVGGTLVAGTRRRPRHLTLQEREAVLVKLRSWLASGELVP